MQASETFGLGEDPVTLPTKEDNDSPADKVVVETTNLLEVPVPLGPPMRSTSVGEMGGGGAAAGAVGGAAVEEQPTSKIPCVFKWTAKSSAAVFKRSHTNRRKTEPTVRTPSITHFFN